MRKKLITILLGLAVAATFTACGTSKKPAAESETETQTTEKATEKETEKTTEKATEKITEKQTEKAPAAAQTEVPAVSQPETQAAVQTEASQTAQDVPNSVPAPSVYEEEYLQCPYCAEWFSTQPDGDLWNPYDRHMLEEREIHEGGQDTEQELVQCPDCLNWYEAGNVFRNHICIGKE